jgi:hypothetical protein
LPPSGQIDLDALRQVGDPEVDHLASKLMSGAGRQELYRVFSASSINELEHLQFKNGQLKSFLLQGNQLPEWADVAQMKAASSLFRSNGNEFLFMLGIVSLPYCYAAAKGAISLYHTEKIRKNTEKRLLDTTSFIIDIMKEDAFERSGGGFLAVKLVRLRHALARYYLKRVPEVAALDEVPINQEDMAGTNLAFSYVALRAMPKIGVKFSIDVQNNYLHFWSVIGHMLGLKNSLLTQDIRSAFLMEKQISKRQFAPSKEAKELTRQLVNHYKEQIPNKATTLLIDALMRHLLGDEVSRTIGLKKQAAVYPQDLLMSLLPVFKKYIFPPVQSFDFIVSQIEERQKAFST